MHQQTMAFGDKPYASAESTNFLSQQLAAEAYERERAQNTKHRNPHPSDLQIPNTVRLLL